MQCKKNPHNSLIKHNLDQQFFSLVEKIIKGDAVNLIYSKYEQVGDLHKQGNCVHINLSIQSPSIKKHDSIFNQLYSL